MTLEFERLAIPGPLLLNPPRFTDSRGWFSETYNAEQMKAAGIDIPFVQDNHSFSAAPNTLRGLHFQAPPRVQDKLVRCSREAILDVAVDIRKGSPTYDQWTAQELSVGWRFQVRVWCSPATKRHDHTLDFHAGRRPYRGDGRGQAADHLLAAALTSMTGIAASCVRQERSISERLDDGSRNGISTRIW